MHLEGSRLFSATKGLDDMSLRLSAFLERLREKDENVSEVLDIERVNRKASGEEWTSDQQWH